MPRICLIAIFALCGLAFPASSLAVGPACVLDPTPGAPSGGTVTAAASTAARAPYRSVAVWVLIDGHKGLAGATVRVGKHKARTSAQGTAIIDVPLQGRDFRVRATGGRFAGRRVKGTLLADVSSYDGRVIYVNLPTTFAAKYHDKHPKLSDRVVRARVRRFFGLPHWHNLGSHLRWTNRYLNGAQLLREALTHRGGIDGFMEALHRRQVDGKRRLFRKGDSRGPVARGSGAGSDLILRGLANGVLGSAGGKGLNIALDALGLGGPAPATAEQIDAIRAQLEQITQSLASLTSAQSALASRLEKLGFDDRVADAAPLISKIEDTETELSFIANHPSDLGAATKRARTLALLSDIASFDFKSVQGQISRQVLPTAPGDPEGILKSFYISQLAASKTPGSPAYHFWTPATTRDAVKVYDYYEYWQAMWTMLQIQCMNANPIANGDATKSALVSNVQADLVPQKSVLKPGPPSGSMIDVLTGKQWLTMSLYDYAPTHATYSDAARYARPDAMIQLRPPADPDRPNARVPFPDVFWRAATFEDVRDLKKGAPADQVDVPTFLRARAGFYGTTVSGQRYTQCCSGDMLGVAGEFWAPQYSGRSVDTIDFTQGPGGDRGRPDYCRASGGNDYVRRYLQCQPIKLVNGPASDVGDFRDAGRYDSPDYPYSPCCGPPYLYRESEGEQRQVFWLRTPSAAELSTYYYP